MQNGNGVHSAAHFTIGSDPGGDFYTSPGDPAFYLLHAQIDRVWTIWQMQNLTGRMQVIAGGTTMFGVGSMFFPSLNTKYAFSFLGGSSRSGDLLC